MDKTFTIQTLKCVLNADIRKKVSIVFYLTALFTKERLIIQMRETKPNFPGLVLGLLMRVSMSWIFWIFWITLFVFIYKYYTLPYGPLYFGFEISFVICWGIISLLRIQVGSRAVSRFNPNSLFFFRRCHSFCTSH